MTRFADLLRARAGTPVVVGHRGGRGPGWPPENTLAAFERARAEGAQAVETDVRLCATGEAVLFHDPDLARMTGGDRRLVAHVPAGELRGVKLTGGDDGIPTLAELVAWANEHGMGLNVEVKHDVPDRIALARAVARDVARARVPLVISSFDPLTLAAVALFTPRTLRALLTDVAPRYAPLLHALTRPNVSWALHVHRKQAAAPAIARWKQRGLAVGVWTVNDALEARELARAGADLLITDAPARIVSALA